jgi:hypothetical protein
MVMKYTNNYHSKALQNLPKCGLFGSKTNHLATLTIRATPMTCIVNWFGQKLAGVTVLSLDFSAKILAF